MYYKIGDFSKLTGVPIKTLRYYDEIDLFKPSYQEWYTGYRYYELNQAGTLNKIIKLKELNLSLKEIDLYMKTNDLNILLNKEMEFRKKVEAITNYVEEISFEIKNGDYNEYLKWNGLRFANTPAALEIRDGVAKYYLVFKNGEYFTDFLIFTEEDNLINLNVTACFKDVLKPVLKYLKDEYHYVTFKTDDSMYHNAQFIKDNCNCIKETVEEIKGFDGKIYYLTYLKISLKEGE